MVATPAVTPLTLPNVFTVAMGGVLLPQVPPGTPVLIRLMDEPAQTEAGPLMVPPSGIGFTVMGADALAVPQPVVTV